MLGLARSSSARSSPYPFSGETSAADECLNAYLLFIRYPSVRSPARTGSFQLHCGLSIARDFARLPVTMLDRLTHRSFHPILGIALFNETMNPIKALGIALVLGGVALLYSTGAEA